MERAEGPRSKAVSETKQARSKRGYEESQEAVGEWPDLILRADSKGSDVPLMWVKPRPVPQRTRPVHAVWPPGMQLGALRYLLL